MKKIISYTILIVFILTSCYVYKPFDVEAEKKQANAGMNSNDPRSMSISDGSKPIIKQQQKAVQTKRSANIKNSLRGKNKTEKLNEKDSTITKEQGNKSSSSNLFKGLSKEDSIQKIIKPNKFYKIQVNNKMYKIQAQKWEEDSLVSNIKNKPERVIKVHKNQIEEVLPRQFSKVGSDGFSIAAYIVAAVALVFLL